MLSQSCFRPSADGVSADLVVKPFAVCVPLADQVDAGSDSWPAIEDNRRLLVMVVAEQPILALSRLKVVSIGILIWTMVN